jgi:hypothetical protein
MSIIIINNLPWPNITNVHVSHCICQLVSSHIIKVLSFILRPLGFIKLNIMNFFQGAICEIPNSICFACGRITK